MLVDTITVMIRTFHACRHARPDAESLLLLLEQVLPIAEKHQQMVLEISFVPNARLFQETEFPLAKREANSVPLTVLNRPLFTLAYYGALNLKQLWNRAQFSAVRSLGYALHPIPPLICSPHHFSVNDYDFCLRIAIAYWNEYSSELQEAFCAIVNQDRKRLTTLAQADDYPIQGW